MRAKPRQERHEHCESLSDGAIGVDVEFDEQGCPLVVVAAPEAFEDDDLRCYFEMMRRFREERKLAYCVVVDLRTLQRMSADQRAMLSRHLSDPDPTYGLITGVAVLCPTALFRGLMVALLWARRPHFQCRAFSDEHEAHRWSRSTVGEFRESGNRPTENFEALRDVRRGDAMIGGVWCVCVEFPEGDSCEPLIVELRVSGYAPEVEVRRRGERCWHVVHAGPFARRSEAVALRDALRASGYQGVLLRYQPRPQLELHGV